MVVLALLVRCSRRLGSDLWYWKMEVAHPFRSDRRTSSSHLRLLSPQCTITALAGTSQGGTATPICHAAASRDLDGLRTRRSDERLRIRLRHLRPDACCRRMTHRRTTSKPLAMGRCQFAWPVRPRKASCAGSTRSQARRCRGRRWTCDDGCQSSGGRDPTAGANVALRGALELIGTAARQGIPLPSCRASRRV